MTLYGQRINGPCEQSLWVEGCETREQAIESAVGMAIRSGWHPPRWWQFWLPKWPKHCREEYERQRERR